MCFILDVRLKQGFFLVPSGALVSVTEGSGVPPHTQMCTHAHIIVIFNSSLTKTTFCKLTQQPQQTNLTKMKEGAGGTLYKTFFMSYQRQILNKHCKMGYWDV